MIELFAALLIIFLLSTIAVTLRRGLNEIIKGMESVDERLAQIQSTDREHLAAGVESTAVPVPSRSTPGARSAAERRSAEAQDHAGRTI